MAAQKGNTDVLERLRKHQAQIDMQDNVRYSF